jgi:hypothetical protein
MMQHFAQACSLTRPELLARTPRALRINARDSEAQIGSFLQACLRGAQGVSVSRSGP